MSKVETLEQANFNMLKRLGIVSNEDINIQEYKKIDNSPYMPLSIDRLGRQRIALAHNSTLNGDMMADPDMEIVINFEDQQAMAFTYQNDFIPIFQAVDEEDDNKSKEKLRLKLAEFLNQWLKNLISQGFATNL